LQLNRKYELVVTRAAGISAWQFLAPLIVANLLIGVHVRWHRPQHSSPQARCKKRRTLLSSAISAVPQSSESRAMAAASERQTGRHCSWRPGKLPTGGTRLSGATFFLFDQDQRIKERLEAEERTSG
jgi:lipopolysaccharide export system permease protein